MEIERSTISVVPVVYPGKALRLPVQITAVVLMHGGVSLVAERYQGPRCHEHDSPDSRSMEARPRRLPTSRVWVRNTKTSAGHPKVQLFEDVRETWGGTAQGRGRKGEGNRPIALGQGLSRLSVLGAP